MVWFVASVWLALAIALVLKIRKLNELEMVVGTIILEMKEAKRVAEANSNIIHCKGCEYMKEYDDPTFEGYVNHVCTYAMCGRRVKDTDYCSYAMRKQ